MRQKHSDIRPQPCCDLMTKHVGLLKLYGNGFAYDRRTLHFDLYYDMVYGDGATGGIRDQLVLDSCLYCPWCGKRLEPDLG